MKTRPLSKTEAKARFGVTTGWIILVFFLFAFIVMLIRWIVIKRFNVAWDWTFDLLICLAFLVVALVIRFKRQSAHPTFF